ncbi:PAS-domain containing protein [Sulfitobacter sp. MF3-043]|uniref:PAS-domain containing protein n=1 Tax=Sulfitobacter sediminivivens TaxID=3252902 RepID=UPI0036DA2B81
MLELSDVIVVLSVSVLSAACAVWFLQRPKASQKRQFAEPDEPMSLLFDGGVLHHGTNAALTALALQPGTHGWNDLRDTLVPRFPGFSDLPGTGTHGNVTIHASDNRRPDRLEVSWRGAFCWVTLAQGKPRNASANNKSDTQELINLRRASASLPNPVWQEDPSGKVFWCNPAYAALFQLAHGGPVDPDIRLFSEGDQDAPKRVSLRTESTKQPDWYELSVICVDDVTVFHATCINAVVSAENAQRNFVQTLAKTFAHLSIGLAIFDRNGQLALFNPALVDLTGLPAHFLSARPTMLSFFDRLRENRRMPEPKNYLNWRQEIADVIAAASDGRYQETWSLETGQTYSVKGRPHPDGATAFLIEDISAEVTLTRNFRAELELGQSLLDTLDDGLVVFSASGILTFSNAAYNTLWQQKPDVAFADVTILDCISVWQAGSEKNPLWHKVEDYIGAFGEREEWNMPVILNDGGLVTCQLAPISSGATLLRFRVQSKMQKHALDLAANSAD